MRSVVLDTETTGLDPAQGHRVIEIGCVEILNRRLSGRIFHVYLNPERAVDPGAQAVHGLSDEFLADKPLFAAEADAFLDFIAEAELIIHNAPFDLGFLHHELSLLGRPERLKATDTLKMARQMHPGQKNNLDALCRRYEVDNSGRQYHGALLDAELLAEVWLGMTRGQDTLSIEPVAPSAEQCRRAVAAAHLRVLKPSDEEAEAHQRYLADLTKPGKVAQSW